MKAGKQELINAELQRAREAHLMSQLAVEAQLWNSVAGELYYTCFHLGRTLFTKDDIQAHTHSGVKSLLSSRFIKEGKMDKKWDSCWQNFLNTGREEIMVIIKWQKQPFCPW
jgi:uncharacterized protein (UPF0332 family)